MASFVKIIDVPVATPILGVTRVGVLANTSDPEPVSSDITQASCAEVVDANCDRFPDLSHFNARSVSSAIVPFLS
jgi:hypothetical protein